MVHLFYSYRSSEKKEVSQRENCREGGEEEERARAEEGSGRASPSLYVDVSFSFHMLDSRFFVSFVDRKKQPEQP